MRTGLHDYFFTRNSIFQNDAPVQVLAIIMKLA